MLKSDPGAPMFGAAEPVGVVAPLPDGAEKLKAPPAAPVDDGAPNWNGVLLDGAEGPLLLPNVKLKPL